MGTSFSAFLKFFKSEGDTGGDGQDGDDREHDGKEGFDGNTPESVISNLGLLSFFKAEEFVLGEEIAVALRASIDVDAFSNRIMRDEGEAILTDGTAGLRSGRGGSASWRMRSDSIDICGFGNRDVVG